MTAYLIRGFTGPNPDFSFTVEAPYMPVGLELRDLVVAHYADTQNRGRDWINDLTDNAYDVDFELGLTNERSDLRDNHSQRVWLYSSSYCNLDENIYNTSHRCNGDDCEHDDYMITIDVEGDE